MKKVGGDRKEDPTWSALEISDDEDKRHPNLYIPSLYKWRHSIRTQRSQYLQKRKTELEQKLQDNSEAAERLSKAMRRSSKRESFQPFVTAVDVLKRKTELDERRLAQVQRAVRDLPPSLDDLVESHEARTHFGKRLLSAPDREEWPQAPADRKAFAERHGKQLRAFGWLHRVGDSVDFLERNPVLLHSHFAAEELSAVCLALAVQEKFHALRHVASQFVLLWKVQQMARAAEGAADPALCLRVVGNRLAWIERGGVGASSASASACLDPLHPFRRLFREPGAKGAVERFGAEFNESIQKFVWYVRERASRHIRDESVAAGGHNPALTSSSDPIEVLESLPGELRRGFEEQDVLQINRALGRMSAEEAGHHMSRCVQSRLWMPDSGDPATDQRTGLIRSTTTKGPSAAPSTRDESSGVEKKAEVKTTNVTDDKKVADAGKRQEDKSSNQEKKRGRRSDARKATAKAKKDAKIHGGDDSTT